MIEYVVDGFGRRVGKKVNGLLTKQWLYKDQLNPVAELDGTGNLTWVYVYGTKPNIPDYAVRVSDGARYRIISDQLGSPVLVINVVDPNDVLLEARYSAFGEQTVLGGAADAVPFGFAGGRYDPDTGLVRFGAREYEPQTGRWVSKDPVRWKGRQRNLYVYAGNDPVNRRDPRGTDPFDVLLEWEELHRTRNKYNDCPARPPEPVCSADDPRTWEQDPNPGVPVPGMEGKWRASDGSECVYDDDGNLRPDIGTFNYCADPLSVCHFFADVLPHFVFGPGAGGPTQYGYP